MKLKLTSSQLLRSSYTWMQNRLIAIDGFTAHQTQTAILDSQFKCNTLVQNPKPLMEEQSSISMTDWILFKRLRVEQFLQLMFAP
jgi:hypothetical protein